MSQVQPGEHVPVVPKVHPAADQPQCPEAWAGEGPSSECGSSAVTKGQTIKQ